MQCPATEISCLVRCGFAAPYQTGNMCGPRTPAAMSSRESKRQGIAYKGDGCLPTDHRNAALPDTTSSGHSLCVWCQLLVDVPPADNNSVASTRWRK